MITGAGIAPPVSRLGYEPDNRRIGDRFPAGARDFLFSVASGPALVPTHPSVQLVPWAVSWGVKRQEPEVDHSPSSSSEVRNGGVLPPLPQTPSGRNA
jgi:hypothetical protein